MSLLKLWSSIIIISRVKTLQVKVVAAVEVAVGDGFHDVGLADLDAGGRGRRWCGRL